jgi:ornithine carbamoyltransferase
VSKRDFLTLSDLSRDELRWVIDRARWLKRVRKEGLHVDTLRGKTLGLLFEKPSTRTRVSFEAGMAELGGHAIVLPQSESQMARGEPIADTARVLARYLSAIVMRTFAHARITEFASHSGVPVINGLTDTAHPAQLLADLMTVSERFNSLEGQVIAFVGDGATNMALSWIEAASILGFELRIAAPTGYQPSPAYIARHPGKVTVTDDPRAAVAGATVINTDVWTSMGQEAELARRKAAFAGFIVDAALLGRAHKNAIVLHCLPAHRGEEISADVLEGPQSAVWDQAENRLHSQKALIELLLLPTRPQPTGSA